MYIKHSCDTFGTIWMPYVHSIWLKCSLVSGRPIRYFYCSLTHFQPSVVFGRSTLVGYYVRLSVCPSVRASLSFLKIGSLVFSDIVHDDSWPWHLVTDGAWFLKKKKKKKKNWQQRDQNQAQNYVFSSLVHYFSLKWHTMISCNNVYHLVELNKIH